jgi:hypothetical protein
MATAIPGVAFDDDANRTAFHSGLAGRATQPRRLATPSGIHRAQRATRQGIGYKFATSAWVAAVWSSPPAVVVQLRQ